MIGDPMEAWKARGRELNKVYGALAAVVSNVLPPRNVVRHAPSVDAAVQDIEELGAEVERLRETVGRIFRDRREADKVTAYCLQARPDLTETATPEGGSHV